MAVHPPKAILRAGSFLASLCLALLAAGPSLGATAWPPVPLAWEGEGTVPRLLRLEAVYQPPATVTTTAVVVAGSMPGELILAVPDRSGLGGAASVRLEANGVVLATERAPAGDAFRWRDLQADLMHTARLDLEPGQMTVLRAEVELRDVWLAYLEAELAPAWHRGGGPLLVPHWSVEIDLRPAALWTGAEEADLKGRLASTPPPLPHLPVLSPDGWRRELTGPVWSGRGASPPPRLALAVPAFETEALVLDDPAALDRWLERDPGLTPDAREILAAAVEARSGRPFPPGSAEEAYFAPRGWYRPSKDWGTDVLASVDRRVVERLRGEEPPAAVQAPTRTSSTAREAAAPALPTSLDEARSWIEKARARGTSPREVKLLRNAYFARRGHVFQTPWLQRHFEAQPWYEPRKGAGVPDLSDEEDRIVALLLDFEQDLRAEGGAPASARSASSAPDPRAAPQGLPPGFLEEELDVPRTPEEARAWVERAKEQRLSARAVRAARNAVFALHGRAFSTDWLRAFFETRPWYREDPGYRFDRLTSAEREAVEVLLEYERTLRGS